jgi:hypothetical protein
MGVAFERSQDRLETTPRDLFFAEDAEKRSFFVVARFMGKNLKHRFFANAQNDRELGIVILRSQGRRRIYV